MAADRNRVYSLNRSFSIEEVLPPGLVKGSALGGPSSFEGLQRFLSGDGFADGGGTAEAVEVLLAPFEIGGVQAVKLVDDLDAGPEGFEAGAVGDEDFNAVTLLVLEL
jgi:hypothetical protein